MPLAWRLMDRARRRRRGGLEQPRLREGGPGRSRARPHLCYCHTPMRYAWDFAAEQRALPARLARRRPRPDQPVPALGPGRRAAHVTRFVANSRAVAGRISASTAARPRWCRRRCAPTTSPRAASARTASSTSAASTATSGPTWWSRHSASCPTASPWSAEGRCCPRCARRRRRTWSSSRAWSDEELRSLYRRSRAMVYPVDEDFGIVMAEAQACGTPVISIDAGGALDIVEHGRTGWLMTRPRRGRPAGRRTPRRAGVPGPGRDPGQRRALLVAAYRESVRAGWPR